MRKKFAVGIVFFIIVISVKAQSFSLKGRINDEESKMAVVGATVNLISLKDSTFRVATTADSAGGFNFINLGADSFTLRISSIGYENLSRTVVINSNDVDMGSIILPKTSQELSGVVVQGVTAPATQKGDTIQFNASQFKVNPDASAEDLARKIPGITIENGQVQAQGEQVRRVTIDGRELFGDDATAALRNLPAEIIDKIQVFDRLSDQAQLTGFDDGNSQKEINIITKANMRDGQFGRVFAGYGTDSRYNLGGNATILKGNRKISLVGNLNNINQQNFSQQDLLGVSGNTGGRGGGGGRRGGGNWGGGQGNFMVGQQNGINRTNAFGVNYSDLWGPKATVSGSYFFNNNNNATNQIANRQALSKDAFNLNDTTIGTSSNYNHRVNMRFEYKIDSSNQLIITPSVSFQNNTNERYQSVSTSSNTNQRISDIINRSNSTRAGNNLRNNILYRHSFAKKGRTISVNFTTSYNKNEGETYQDIFSRSYTNGTSLSDSTEKQYTDQFNDGYELSTNIAYTEPLGEKSQLQINYNPSYSKNKADQQTYRYNLTSQKYSEFDEDLSNKFENTFTSHNAGLSYRRGDRDNQISFGVNYQNTNLNSDQVFPTTFNVNKTFSNFLPNAMARFKLSPRANVRMFYRARTNQPSVTQLQNVPDITNRPFIRIGNPRLEQQFMHFGSTRYTYTNTAKGVLFVGNVFFQTADNYITNATTFLKADTVLNGINLRRGEQISQPVNLDGYVNLRSFLTFAIPLKFIKSNFNLNGGVTYSRIPGIVDNVENMTRSMTYSLGTVIASNVSQFVDFTVSYNANFNKVDNEANPSRNDNYFQHVAGLQLNLLSKTGWFFQNDLNNQFYNGLSQGFNQSYFLWNMSVGKKLLKDQKGELKLSVFDLLKQNRSIQRNVEANYIEDVRNEVLTQYFMLTFTYNLRNFGTAAARAANNAERRGGNNNR